MTTLTIAGFAADTCRAGLPVPVSVAVALMLLLKLSSDDSDVTTLTSPHPSLSRAYVIEHTVLYFYDVFIMQACGYFEELSRQICCKLRL